MYIIEKPGKYICGIFRSKHDFETHSAVLPNSDFNFYEVPIERYPLCILQQWQDGKLIFTFAKTRCDFSPTGDAVFYEVTADFTPSRPGEDEMGLLVHWIFEDDEDLLRKFEAMLSAPVSQSLEGGLEDLEYMIKKRRYDEAKNFCKRLLKKNSSDQRLRKLWKKIESLTKR